MQKLTLRVVALALMSVVGCGDDDPNETSSPQGGAAHAGGAAGGSGAATGGAGQASGAGQHSSAGSSSGGALSDGGADGGSSAGAGAGAGAAPGGAGGLEPTCDDWPLPAAPTDVCPGDVTVSSVLAESDADLEVLRGVSIVDGDLRIGREIFGGSFTSLETLSCLTRVTGKVVITDSGLTNLRGLERLTEVGGDFVFDGNVSIGSLTGLESLTRIGGRLAFGVAHYAGIGFQYRSPSVESLCPLRNLTSLGSLLVTLSELRNLAGLERITELGSLALYRNEHLRSLRGLEGLQRIYSEGELKYSTTVRGGLLIESNAIRDLDSLANLRELSSAVIESNPELLDIRAIENARGTKKFSVSSNPLLEQCQVEEVAAELDAEGQLEEYRAFNNGACMP